MTSVALSLLVLTSLFASKKLTNTLLNLTEAAKEISKGNFKTRVTKISNDEVGVLAETFNHMSEEVENLLVVIQSKARIEEEVKTARLVQKTLLPKSKKRGNGFSLCGSFKPANECSGDWWHYNIYKNKIFLWIGDATGHGVPSALMTSAAMSATGVMVSMKGLTPGKALTLMNRSFSHMSGEIMFMTFFAAFIDRETGTLTYSNAAHDPPFLFRKGDDGKYQKRDIIVLNDVNGPRLRSDNSYEYSQADVKLQADDIILCFTDGIYEIENQKNESFSEGHLIRAALAACNSSSEVDDINKALFISLDEFNYTKQQRDDITFFFFKYSGE
jgi:sigma-B regulation protein RsbU (phosphoserine phosphatase)